MTAVAKKLFSYLLKAAIVILAYGFIYRYLISKNENLQQFKNLVSHLNQIQVKFTLVAVIALMLVNWILESAKWQYLARRLARITLWRSIEAVFCGLTWAIFTPNRLGEYGGRVMFLPKRKRIHGVFAMAVGSFGQNVITNVLGAIAILWFLYSFIPLNAWALAGVTIIGLALAILMLVLYFRIAWFVVLLNKIPFLRKFNRFFEIMGRYDLSELINVMCFCLARFFVFSFQYYLVIHLLIPQLTVFTVLMMVFIMFFIQSAVPSLDLLDVGVRSLTASVFFAYVTDQKIAVIAAISSIWFINLIIPAILGSIFVFKIKFFDNSI